MAEADSDAGHGGASLLAQWEEEQRKWQQTMLSFVDAAAQDESFLVHLGNAMRGSLLAGKPYPGTSPGGAPSSERAADGTLDELTFSVRRMEGKLNELVMIIEELSRRKPSAPDADTGPTTA